MRQRGQGLVELAIALPILVILLVTIIEGAALLRTQMCLDNDVREIARLAARGTTPENVMAYADGMLREGAALRLSYVTVNFDGLDLTHKINEYITPGGIEAPPIDPVTYISDQRSMLDAFIFVDWSPAFTNTAGLESYDVAVEREGQRATWLVETKGAGGYYRAEYRGDDTATLSFYARAHYDDDTTSPWSSIGQFTVPFDIETIKQPYRVVIAEVVQKYIPLIGLLDIVIPDRIYSKTEMRVLPMRGLTE